MRKYFLMILLAAAFSASLLNAQEKKFGIGVMIGAPTGFNGKYWLNNRQAIDFGIAYSFVEPKNSFSIHSDFLYHITLDSPSFGEVQFYYGFGGRIRINKDETSLGARGAAGCAIAFRNSPIDVFLEVAPVFKIIPNTALNLDAAIGVRFYF